MTGLGHCDAYCYERAGEEAEAAGADPFLTEAYLVVAESTGVGVVAMDDSDAENIRVS